MSPAKPIFLIEVESKTFPYTRQDVPHLSKCGYLGTTLVYKQHQLCKQLCPLAPTASATSCHDHWKTCPVSSHPPLLYPLGNSRHVEGGSVKIREPLPGWNPRTSPTTMPGFLLRGQNVPTFPTPTKMYLGKACGWLSKRPVRTFSLLKSLQFDVCSLAFLALQGNTFLKITICLYFYCLVSTFRMDACYLISETDAYIKQNRNIPFYI